MVNWTIPSSTETSTEITDYLSQPPLAEDAKPLEWWRYNRIRYPFLNGIGIKQLELTGVGIDFSR